MARCTLKHWVVVRRRSGSDGGTHEHLIGQVYGDPKRPDGTLVTTSRIVSRDGATAVTASGSEYDLDGAGADAEATPGRATA